jgi:hypothetical protein
MDLLNVSGLVGLFVEQGLGNTRKDDQMDYKIMGQVSSNDATNILISAQAHQKKASDKRLSQRPSTARGADGGINLPIHKNAMKATGVQKDKKEKREEAKLLGKGIRIAATLWKVDSSKNNKLVEVFLSYLNYDSEGLDHFRRLILIELLACMILERYQKPLLMSCLKKSYLIFESVFRLLRI